MQQRAATESCFIKRIYRHANFVNSVCGWNTWNILLKNIVTHNFVFFFFAKFIHYLFIAREVNIDKIVTWEIDKLLTFLLNHKSGESSNSCLVVNHYSKFGLACYFQLYFYILRFHSILALWQRMTSDKLTTTRRISKSIKSKSIKDNYKSCTKINCNSSLNHKKCLKSKLNHV